MNAVPTNPDSPHPLHRALQAIESLEARLEQQRRATTEAIAITGIGCRFPGGADDPQKFWELLSQGRDAVTRVPASRWDADAFHSEQGNTPGRMVTRHGGFLESLEYFDPGFFGISPREAARMDPQHRLLLEVAWEALAAAGRTPDRRANRNIGVFVGITSAEYTSLQLQAEGPRSLDTYHLTGNALNTAAGRLSFVFGLHGPALAVDTACSSSLTAVHLACQSLRRAECDSALAAGVNALLSPVGSIALSRGQVLAPSGRARTFDEAADGMVRGEGCGAIVLRRLSDAERDGDPVLAIIRGSAINQDGPSSGLTVPHRPAQERLLRDALVNAGLTPQAVDYVEAHGTGTPLGDPIEVGALGDVFANDRHAQSPLLLGSVKTNFGHLESAAGIAGLIKTVLALHHEALPPHLHFTHPSSKIDWRNGALQVPTELTPWPRSNRARIAGISSFGFSGTNAHLLLEEAPSHLTAPELTADPPAYERQCFSLPPPQIPDDGLAFDLPGRLVNLPNANARHFKITLHATNPIWVRDHRVFGHRVFPAAGWFELARRAGQSVGQPVLREGRILRALVIPEHGGVELHTVVEPDGAVAAYSRAAGQSEWTQHFAGRVDEAGPSDEQIEPLFTQNDLPSIPVAELYEEYERRGIDYGPIFRGVIKLSAEPGKTVAEIQLPAEAPVSAYAGSPAPALLDACFQAAGAAFAAITADDDAVVHLPVAISDWKLERRDTDFTAPLKMRAAVQTESTGAVVSLQIFNANDQVVASMGRLELQRATPAALAAQLETSVPHAWLYEFKPIPQPLTGRAALDSLSGDWLIVDPAETHGSALADSLRRAGASPTVATEFVPGSWDGVLVLAGFDIESDDPDIAQACAPLLACVQAWGEATPASGLWIITPPPMVRPSAAALWGFGRVIQAEWTHRETRLLGLPSVDPDIVLTELVAASRENQIIHSETGRQILRLVPLPPQPRAAWELAPDKTYLITGGRGALGLLSAEWLISSGARHLVLLGRNPPAEATRQKIAEWQSAGVTVAVPEIDLAEASAVRAMIDALINRGPPIAGVIHAAGGIKDAVLADQSVDHFAHTAAAKSQGASHLAKAISQAQRPLDFWINYTSSAGVLGTPGQANYAAANAWLDAFTASAARTLNLAWGPWAAGLGATVGDRYQSRGVSSIQPAQAFALLETLRHGPQSGIAVLPIDWSRFFATDAPTNAAPILDRVRPPSPRSPTTDAVAEAPTPSDFSGALRQQIARVLRVDVDRLDDSLSLPLQGLDSLMAMELRNAVQQATGTAVSSVTFLNDTPLGELVSSLSATSADGRHEEAVQGSMSGTKPDSHEATDLPVGRALRPTSNPNQTTRQLSRGQSALWFLHQSDPGSAAYHTAFALRLSGPIDADRLKTVITRLVERHPQLRARFPREAGNPICQIASAPEYPFVVSDASDLSPTQLKQQITRDYEKPFNLERDSPFRVSLYVQPDQTAAVLLCTIHHIVSDAWTNWLLLDEFSKLYPDTRELPPPTADYANFITWQDTYLQSPAAAAAWNFWQGTLAGPLPELSLPLDHDRPASLPARGASVPLHFAPGLFDQIQTLARQQGATVFTLLMTAWQVWLHRHTGQTDIIVGSPTAGRSQAEFTAVAGYFVNPVPFRAELEPLTSFTDLLAKNRAHHLEVLAHADYPLPLLVEKLKVRRDPSRSAIFQNLFVYQKPQQSEEAPQASGQACGDLHVEEFPFGQMEGQFELTLEIFAGGTGSLKYNTALFDASSAERFAARLSTLLESVVATPDQPIARLPLLPPAERELVTHTWQPDEPNFSCEHTLVEQLLQQARKSPEAPALVFERESLSYAELYDRARALAASLQSAGVGPDVLVGVCAERSPELVIALLGIVLAGGAYVPFDPSYPEERLEFMHRDSGVKLMLTTTALAEAWRGRAESVWNLEAELPMASSPYREPSLRPDHAAYLIYTSGSTGRPKGALNIHRAIVNRLAWMQDQYRIDHTDTILQKTPFSFDVSVWEFFWPLLQGSRLVLARPGGHQDPGYLRDLIIQEQVTHLHFVPSMLGLFVDVAALEQCTSLRRIICSGEALPADLPARLFARHPTVELHNLYGPTEAAIDVSYWACHRDAAPGPIPIGRPVARTQLHVLNKGGVPQPIGVPGELHIGGVQLMRGYHGRPELNAEKLIPDPFSPTAHARLYRTGDLVSWRPDGALDYHGRMDDQVKLRGFRIELGEIETALADRAGIREAAVTLRQEPDLDAQLVAYFIPESAEVEGINIPRLRTKLRQFLPDYMVPATFVRVDAWPLSPNGKRDLKALPVPPRATDSPVSSSAPSATASPVEAKLRDRWAELLGCATFGLDDNFFDLGGHSLHLGRLHAELQTAGYADLTLVELFQYPTIRTLARRLDGTSPDRPSVRSSAETSSSRPGTLAHQRAQRRKARNRS